MGPRKVLTCSFFLCSTAVAWFALSNHYWEGEFSRMLMGFSSASSIICAFCLGGRWFKKEQFTLLVALTEFLALVGGVIGKGDFAKSVTLMGWRHTMLVIAGIGFFLTLLVPFIIRNYPEKNESVKSKIAFSELIKQAVKDFKKVVMIKQIWINGLYAALVFSIFSSFAALWSVPYIATRFGVAVETAAAVASFCFIGASLGTLTLGCISATITRHRLIMQIGSLISCACLVLIIYLPGVSLQMMFVLFFMLGYFSCVYALSFAIVGNFADPSTKGVTMGLMNMLSISLGAPVLQPLIGFLLKLTVNTSYNQ